MRHSAVRPQTVLKSTHILYITTRRVSAQANMSNVVFRCLLTSCGRKVSGTLSGTHKDPHAGRSLPTNFKPNFQIYSRVVSGETVCQDSNPCQTLTTHLRQDQLNWAHILLKFGALLIIHIPH